MTLLPAGKLRRIYVDRGRLDQDAPIAILTGDIKNPEYASWVKIKGTSVIRFEPDEPLWSSARVWVETEAAVEIDRGT